METETAEAKDRETLQPDFELENRSLRAELIMAHKVVQRRDESIYRLEIRTVFLVGLIYGLMLAIWLYSTRED